MTKIYVVLFDDEDRRGWLVDGASAVLHLVRAQLAVPPYSDSKLLRIEYFHHADPKGGEAAKAALLDDRNRSMRVEEDWEYSKEITSSKDGEKSERKKSAKTWTVQDLIRQTWHTFELISAQQAKIKPVHLRGTPREKLEGWSMKDIIESENRMEPRIITLKASGRGWVDFTRSVHAVTLFGRGIGDLLKPAYPAQCFPHWRRVPTGQDYLATRVYTLRAIWDKYGDDNASPLRLTEDIV